MPVSDAEAKAMLRQSRPGNQWRAPQHVQGILTRALKRFGLDEQIARYSFVQHWGAIVGPRAAKISRPEMLTNGVLVVRVASSAWAQELTFQQDVIFKRLSKYVAPELLPRSLRFQVGSQQEFASA